jgi:DNA-binding SARP family transcriptional activator
VRLGLLGGFRLEVQSDPVLLPLSAQRLLAFLALQPRAVSRVFAGGLLWPDCEESHAAGRLRSALWRLQREAPDVVRSRDRSLSLTEGVELDVRRTSELSRAALEGAALPTRAELEELCAHGSLLPDWYDEWADVERERLRQLRLHALERLCERLTAEGRLGDALEAGLAAVASEPLRESAHRAMIAVHLAEGNLSEAMRQYETCERMLERALGVSPSAATRRLVEQAVAGSRRGASLG